MTERSFFRWALLVPVIVTLVAILLVGSASGIGYYPTSGPVWFVVDLAQVIIFSWVWGAVPYGVVSTAIFVWLRKPRANYFRVLVIAPMAVVIVGVMVIGIVSAATRDINLPAAAGFFALWAMVFGYAYVLLICGAYQVARKARWVLPAS